MYPIFKRLLANQFGEPVCEHRFHPKRRWRFDFAYPEHMVAIEVEGLVYKGKSRHTTVSGYKGDLEKYNEAAILGWKVIRFSQDQLIKSSTFDTIKRAISLG
jgi:very-short-patch-repair endonuclease